MVAPSGGGNEEISYTIKINVAAAKAALAEILNSTDTMDGKILRLKQLILDWSISTGNNTNKVAAAFKILAGQISELSPKLVTSANTLIKVDQALTPLPPKLNETSTAAGEGPTGLAGTFSKLGTVSQFVFGTVLGITAISVLRNLIDFFKQAIDAGIKFSQTQLELEIGARATQRMGQETTIQQYEQQIADIQKKYPIFSRTQATEAYSNALILTRGLKLTKEQFQELIDVSASASVVLGRDFGETATGIAKSLSSGWFEAAQRAGFLISRQSVIAEGLALGIENAKNGYNAMTEYERAISALSRYVKENGSIQQDVSVVMESQAGKVKIAKAAWDNYRLSLGQIYSPIAALIANALTPLLQFFDEMNKAGLASITLFMAFGKAVQVGLTQIFSGNLKAIISFDWKAEIQKQFDALKGFTGLTNMMGNAGYDAGSAFGNGLEEGAGGAADAFQKLTYDIIDEQTKLKNKLEDIWRDYQRKLADIINDAERQRAQATLKYNEDVANANIDAANRRAEAERKYRIGEINAEARFQEQLRQLRTKFLFDLEDALRERDARQVLRLTRQYQMDKENVTKEAELAYNERKRAFDEELRQIAEQRAERLRLLAQQFADEMAQIAANEAQKRLDALMNYEIAKEDAQQAADDRIKQQVLDFQRQYGLTQKQAQALVNLLAQYFGTGGPVAKIYKNLVQYIMSLVGIAQAGLQSLNGMNTTIPGYGTPPTPLTQQYAKGGTVIATKATRAIFGEAGPEVATFTPLNQLSQHQQNVVKAFSDINVNNNQQGTGGNLELVVTLDPNLKAEIVNESMYNVSAIVREVNRSR